MKFPLQILSSSWNGLIRIVDADNKVVLLANDKETADFTVKNFDRPMTRDEWLFAHNTFGTVHEKA